eukprot:NODE_14143_length_1126_cov_2.522523.p2 GENE.NODE_14143_length_1126_cov_2.522523~~NODE_14143_length_1126_cov_2.522523.p2  ORF type:complete len:187 (-),score=59.57 NODE_14143_length_1126_cov_2.522523:55-615(-)
MLLTGISVMIVSLAVLAVSFAFRTCSDSDTSLVDCDTSDISMSTGWTVLAVVGLCTYVSGYQIGYASNTWLVNSEIYPVNIRSAAISNCVVLDLSGWFIMALTEGTMWDSLTISCLIELALAIGLLYLPRSPRWLLFQAVMSDEHAEAHQQEASAALQFFRNTADVGAELEEMKQETRSRPSCRGR